LGRASQNQVKNARRINQKPQPLKGLLELLEFVVVFKSLVANVVTDFNFLNPAYEYLLSFGGSLSRYPGSHSCTYVLS
jgi:hypothetical protein